MSVWFPRLPDSWAIFPFECAVTDATSGNPKVKKSDYKVTGILPVIDQGQDFVGGYVNDPDLRCQVDLPVILFGDHTKIFKFVSEPFVLGADGVKVLKPKEGLDERFLFHYLNAVRLPDAVGYSRHFKFLKRIDVPKPPIERQRRIAAILDKADAIRRKREQALALTDDFLRSTFLEMFGDPATNPKGLEQDILGNVIKVASGDGLTSSAMDQSGHYLVYGGNGVTGHHSEYLFSEPTIVIGRVGVYCGAVHVTAPKSWVTDNALYVQNILRPDIDFTYLSWALHAANLNQHASQSAQPLISGGRIYPVKILIPAIKAQIDFANQVERQTGFAEILRGAMQDAERLFASLSQRAFRGEL